MLIRLNMHVSDQNFYIWHSASSWLVPQITAAYISVELYFLMIVYCHCKYLFRHMFFYWSHWVCLLFSQVQIIPQSDSFSLVMCINERHQKGGDFE